MSKGLAPASGVPGVIYKGDEPFYQIQQEDHIWLARMMAGESSDWEDRKAQLWTMAQRFVLRNKRYENTLRELVIGFSQPVNPRWMRNGSYCQPGGRGYGKTNCSEAAFQRRERLRREKWEPHQLQQELQLVQEWADGRVPNNVPKSVDWHARNLTPGYTEIGDFPNRFQASPASMRWPDNYVRVGGAADAPDAAKPRGGFPWGIFAALVIAAGGAAMLYRSTR
jgi:hypothetical protein